MLSGGTVTPVDPVDDVPAVGLEASADVLGEGDVGAAVDGDAVAVVEADQLARRQSLTQGLRLSC